MLTATALLHTVRLVGRMFAGSATTTSGAAPTTIIDTNQKSTSDDFYNGGLIFFTSGANANVTRTITDYVNSTRTFTFSPALASIITSGDRYEAARSNYSRAELVQAVNQALQEMGEVTTHDDTLLVLADTDEYTLPSGVARLVRVEVAAESAAPYGWERNNYWQENGGSLIFDPGKAPSTAGNKIRVWYNGQHAAVNADTDVISNYVHAERLAWTAAYYAAYNRARVVEQADPVLKDVLQLTATRMAEMIQRHPVRNMPRDPRYSGW